MRLVVDMKKKLNTETEKSRTKPESIEPIQISEEKENKETVKKERCEPCMHCGVHCIFLKEDQ